MVVDWRNSVTLRERRINGNLLPDWSACLDRSAVPSRAFLPAQPNLRFRRVKIHFISLSFEEKASFFDLQLGERGRDAGDFTLYFWPPKITHAFEENSLEGKNKQLKRKKKEKKKKREIRTLSRRGQKRTVCINSIKTKRKHIVKHADQDSILIYSAALVLKKKPKSKLSYKRFTKSLQAH